jgi:tetratricopeptide (TPR) repeat protein
MRTTSLGLAALLLASCETPRGVPESGPPAPHRGPETLSLSGEPLFAPELAPDARARRERELRDAEGTLEARSDGADELVWYGRRLAYLGRYRDAIDVYTRGIALHADDPRFYRHRGHRWITLRRFDRAVEDLERAARLVEGRPDEIEPAGIPNERGVVVDTLNHGIYYHLGLARYLRGELDAALAAWRSCALWSKNPDALCSVTHWLYVTLRRLGRDGFERDPEVRALLEPIRADLDVVEYHAYHRLCLAYRGEVSFVALWDEIQVEDGAGVDSPTIGYGVANWHLVEGRSRLAHDMFRTIAKAPMWAAFGRIAAEVEIARDPADADGFPLDPH